MTDETLMRAQTLRGHIATIEQHLKQLDAAMKIINELKKEPTPSWETGIRIIVEGGAKGSVHLLVDVRKAPDMENLIAGIREQVVKDLEATKTEFENLYMCRKNTSGLIRAYYTEQIVKGWFALIAGALLGLVIWWIETTGVK